MPAWQAKSPRWASRHGHRLDQQLCPYWHRHQQQLTLGRDELGGNTTLVSDGAAQASTINPAIGGNQTVAGTQEVTGNSSDGEPCRRRTQPP